MLPPDTAVGRGGSGQRRLPVLRSRGRVLPRDERTFSLHPVHLSVRGLAGHAPPWVYLVKALTGIDPDRLREEKERAMTIDLGFAWLTLPSAARSASSMSPGHERFIKNMLAGVGGIDLALLVIAADEGPMPRPASTSPSSICSRCTSIVVLTKGDTVDPDWLELVQEEVRERLSGPAWRAPLVAVRRAPAPGWRL